MNMKFVVCVGVLSVALAVLADSDENASRWSFSAGPSWRSRVKMETRGTAYAVPATAGFVRSWDTADPDPTAPASWDGKTTVVTVPAQFFPAPGDTAHAFSATRSDVTTVAGSGLGTINTSDEDAPLGLNVQGCYDFLKGETWSVGLNLRFAGYWNMKSSGSCSVDAGTIATRQYVDTWYFLNDDPSIPLISGLSAPSDYVPGTDPTAEWTVPSAGSRAVSTRLRSDLYQIGLGPKVTWSPFVGWCDSLSWLDVYGCVEVLCNIAHSDFDADGHSSSQTDCLLGFGGNVGLVGNITENVGIYGQVGYEWIDKSDVSTGGFKADVDYSSLVLSAGVQVRF